MDYQRKYELAKAEGGGFELVDKSVTPFKPTEEQVLFLERWLWDWEYSLSAQKAMESLGGTMGDLKRWKRDPAFIQLIRVEREKRFAGTLEHVKADIQRAAEDPGYELPKKLKWAYGKVLKIEENERAFEFKAIQINNTQHNTFNLFADMSEADLKRFANSDEGQTAIEGTAG